MFSKKCKTFAVKLPVVVLFGLLACMFVGCGSEDSVFTQTSMVVDKPVAEDSVFVEPAPDEEIPVETDGNLLIAVDDAQSDVVAETAQNVDEEPVSTNTKHKCRTEFNKDFVPGQSVFMGNSLLLGYGLFGMSASAVDNDYFSIIKNYFVQNEIPFEATRVASSIESMTTIANQEAFMAEKLYPYLSDTTGLVVLQLGDNMDLGRALDMEESVSYVMDQVCERAQNARVLWVGEWYSSEVKQALLKRLANEYNITFVDIADVNREGNHAHVGDVISFPQVGEFEINYQSYVANDDSLSITFVVEEKSYTSTIKVESFEDRTEEKVVSWIGSEFIVANAFVASHPNDEAFAEIASRILGALGYSF